MLTHYNIVSNIVQMKEFDHRYLDFDRDSQIGVLPFFHVYVSLRNLNSAGRLLKLERRLTEN